MKIGGRALISTVLLALLLICASHAQDSVTLTGIEAVREGDSAIIQLNTSGSADFRLDRFTMGNWVTVWSSRLSLGFSDDQEHELELELSDMTDLVTRATQVSGRHHGELRFYLGDNVDASAITIRREDDMTVLVIPALGLDQPAAGNSLLEPFASSNTSGGSFFIPRNEAQEETHVDEGVFEPTAADSAAAGGDDADDRLPVAVMGVSSDFGSDGSEPAELAELESMVQELEISDEGGALPETEATERSFEETETETVSTESDSQPRGSGVAPGRFKSQEQVDFVRREEKKKGIVVPPQDEDDASESIMPGIDSSSSQDGLAGEARINVQRNLQGEPQEKADDVDRLLDDMKNGGGEGGESQPAPAPSPEGIKTPKRSADPYANPAAINLGGAMGGKKVGKAALEDLAIELFQIVDTPLDQAFTLLFQQTDYNVIVDASVGSENTVSLSFKDGTTNLREALDLMTRTYNLEYVVNANTVVIASKEKMYSGLIDFETRVFVLSYADPKNVKEILINTGVVGEKQVEAYLGEQEFIAEGGGDTILSNDDTGDVTAKPIQTNISTTPRNAVVVKGTPDEIRYVAALIDDIDRKPKRVELEVKVCEANESALKNLGLEFNPNQETPSITQTWTEQFDTIDYWIDPLGAIDENPQRFQDFSIGSFDRGGLQFQATLNLQIQNGNVETLAQPTLNTVDGKQAIYFAGERIPYISSVTQEQGAITQEISFLPVGVTLNFKPRLDAEELITIDVNPVISSLTEFRQIGGVEAPRTSSRQLATTVRVMDGQPFVMAGLITSTERETITKIPMLGDLPLLGKLFRNKRKDGQRTEIIIVVTPHIYD